MADIARAAQIMAAADAAASLIENSLTDVSDIIKDLNAEGVISNVESLAWHKKLKAVGAGVSGKVLGIHADLTDRAQHLGIDLPPAGDGTAELIARASNAVSPLSGGR